MKVELYHYLHCPFCIRVRMVLGFLKIPWKSYILPYDDENTPKSLTNKKMLPIAVIDGKAMNESLDIIQVLDHEKRLESGLVSELEPRLDHLAKPLYLLAMPYWIWSPEFTPEAQRYFLHKKELKRGPFSELIKRRAEFEKEVHLSLDELSVDLNPFYKSAKFTLADILIAAQVWGLYSVPEFRFNDHWHEYLQSIKDLTDFNFSEFFWRNP
jgi:glutaredoxin 2